MYLLTFPGNWKQNPPAKDHFHFSIVPGFSTYLGVEVFLTSKKVLVSSSVFTQNVSQKSQIFSLGICTIFPKTLFPPFRSLWNKSFVQGYFSHIKFRKLWQQNTIAIANSQTWSNKKKRAIQFNSLTWQKVNIEGGLIVLLHKKLCTKEKLKNEEKVITKSFITVEKP